MYIAKAKLNDFAAILKLQYIAYESEAIRYNDFNIPPLTQTLEQLIKMRDLTKRIKKLLYQATAKQVA